MKKRIIPLLITGILMSILPIYAQEERVDVVVETVAEYPPDVCADILLERFPNSKLHYVYDTLMNGFSVELTMTQYLMLGTLEFVSRAAVSGTYEVCETDIVSELSAQPNSMIGIDKARENGLDGSGTIIAVIDSGFDIDHTAFSNPPGAVKLTKEYLASLVKNFKLSAVRGNVTEDQLYISDRIPFAYDYSESDTDVSNGSDHGTHVAGIIGAYGKFEGVAPKCQLLLMKVFGEDGTTTDFALIAALEDAVRLGADVINLSLGRYSGSAEKQMINGLGNLFERAESYGCMIVCAAGNEAYSAARGVSDADTILPPADYTDYGTLSYPASADYTFAVGSVDSNAVWGVYFLCGDERIYYSDTNKAGRVLNSTFPTRFSGYWQYVVIPGVGNYEDYDGINASDKLVLVERGELTFVEKANIAAEHGAVGMIVCNNIENETMSMELSGAAVPAISITKESGEILKNAKLKRLEFSNDFKVVENASNAWKVSNFSSYGATPSLTIGLDICGVGGGIYSSIVDGYGGLSGTSMAAPQISGVCALLSQKLGYNMLRSERVGIIKETLMNTAEPILQENGIEYSPRRQGAGLVNINKAIDRELSITYSKSKSAKAELFDLLKNKFSFDITLKNLTDSELELNLYASLTSDGYTETDNVFYSTLISEADVYSKIICDKALNINMNAEDFEAFELVIEPYESRTVTLDFEIDSEYDALLSEIFTNGRFAEGFIYCSTENYDYSMPYMGYIGDWSDTPILDYSPESGKAVFGGTYLLTDVSGILLEAGINFFTDEKERGLIAFSPDQNGAGDVLWLRTELLRNAVSGELSVKDSSGNEVYYLYISSYHTKSEGVPDLRAPMLCWDGSDGSNSRYKLPDGAYTLNYTFKLDYYDESQTLTYTAVIDTKAPTLSEAVYDADKKILKIKASDENELQYIKLSESDKDEFRLVEVTSEAECIVIFDLSDFTGDRVYIEVVDKAYNSIVECYVLSEIQEKI